MPQVLKNDGQAKPMVPLATGLALGTKVMTMTGVRPVEKLVEGDRIVTRTGASVLRRLMRTRGRGFRLIFDAPQVVFLGEGQVHGETGLPFAA